MISQALLCLLLFTTAVLGEDDAPKIKVSSNSTVSSTTFAWPTLEPDCAKDAKDSLGTTLTTVLALCVVFQVIFGCCVVGAAVMIILKLNDKSREAETHLHQVMDATLCALLPESVVGEINAIAEEAQVQDKKPKGEKSKKDEKEEKVPSGKSPAKKE